MNDHRESIRSVLAKAPIPLPGKPEQQTRELLRRLDWKKAAVAAVGTVAVVSAVSTAAQYRFYRGIVARELKRQLGPLREQLDEIQAENRQLRRELQQAKGDVREPGDPDAQPS